MKRKPTEALTQCGRIQALLYGRKMTANEVQFEIRRLTGKAPSGSAITARIRELRHLGWQVDCSVLVVNDRRLYLYTIPKPERVVKARAK